MIYDLLSKEYGVNESNISKAISFDLPSLLTIQDKFDILLYQYKKEYGFEALAEIIKKYNLDSLKYIQSPSLLTLYCHHPCLSLLLGLFQ